MKSVKKSGQVKKQIPSSRFGSGQGMADVCVAGKPRTFKIPTFGTVDIQPDGTIRTTVSPFAVDVICTIGRSKNRAIIALLWSNGLGKSVTKCLNIKFGMDNKGRMQSRNSWNGIQVKNNNHEKHHHQSQQTAQNPL